LYKTIALKEGLQIKVLMKSTPKF